MSSISCVKRIALLTELVLQSCSVGLVEAIKLAKDLAYTIDELNRHKITFEKLESEFCALFPEHWQKRTQFLQIITKHWPNILLAEAKTDVQINDKFPYQYHCLSRGLCFGLDIKAIKNKMNVFEADDIFEESEFIFDIVKENNGKKISIVSPDSDFSELLYNRFCLDDVDIFHKFEKFDRIKIKSFFLDGDIEKCSLPEFTDFYNEIQNEFSIFEKKFNIDIKKIVILLLDFFKHEKSFSSNISIIKISDIKYCLDDIIILSSLNESAWKSNVCGEYWLHESLRKKIGLRSLEDEKKVIVDDFYASFNNISEIYFTRSKKINGIFEQKSSIFTKFEIIGQKNNLQVNIKNSNKNYCEIAKQKNDHLHVLPNQLSAQSLELLLRDSEGFYAKEVLNLAIRNDHMEQHNFQWLFKKMMYSYFKNDAKTDCCLNMIKDIDFFGYQKCRNILHWLTDNNMNNSKSLNNVSGEMIFTFGDSFGDSRQLNIFSYADRIDGSSLIAYKNIASNSVRDIIYGSKISLLTTCLIAKNGGFCEQKIDINEVQIWSIASSGYEPMDIRKIAISPDVLDTFELRLKDILNDYCLQNETINNVQNQAYNKYKHFKRG